MQLKYFITVTVAQILLRCNLILFFKNTLYSFVLKQPEQQAAYLTWETGMASRGAAFVLSGSAAGALLGVSSPGGLPVPLLDMPTREGNAAQREGSEVKMLPSWRVSSASSAPKRRNFLTLCDITCTYTEYAKPIHNKKTTD